MLCKIQRTGKKASRINWKISVQTGRIYVQSPLYLSMKKSREVMKCGHSYSSEQSSNCTVTLNHLSRRNLHRCKPYSCKPLITQNDLFCYIISGSTVRSRQCILTKHSHRKCSIQLWIQNFDDECYECTLSFLAKHARTQEEIFSFKFHWTNK